MELTRLGIKILFKEMQSLKAHLSIRVILLGRVMLLNELQPQYLQPVITQYFVSYKSEIWA